LGRESFLILVLKKALSPKTTVALVLKVTVPLRLASSKALSSISLRLFGKGIY